MKTAELRDLTKDELEQKLASLKRELFEYRMQASASKLDKPHKILLARRDAARVSTVLSEIRREEKAVVSPEDKKGT